jgi:hypothetical protein
MQEDVILTEKADCRKAMIAASLRIPDFEQNTPEKSVSTVNTFPESAVRKIINYVHCGRRC